MLDSIDYFNVDEDVLAFTSLHTSFAQFDNMGRNCYYAFTIDLSKDHWDTLFGSEWLEGIPVNLLYNAGFMWVDGVNWWFYNP